MLAFVIFSGMRAGGGPDKEKKYCKNTNNLLSEIKNKLPELIKFPMATYRLLHLI